MNAQDIRNAFMQRFNLTDDIIQKGTITTGANGSGPTYISSNPKHDSAIKPVYVTIDSIDVYKEFGGNPNELYTSNQLTAHHDSLPEWSAARTDTPYSELSAQEKTAICNAFQTYIYGNSETVQSYKDALQKYYFPAQLAILAGQDIVVTPGNPLVLSGDGDQPVTYSFGTVTIQPGGQIINEANATLLVDTIIQETAASAELGDTPVNSFVSLGPDGANGGAGGNGGNGDPGSQGSASSSGKSSCDTSAGQGGTGGTGQPGSPGGPGQNGSDAQVVKANLTTVQGPITLGSWGGDGGIGGNGGNAGNGGVGGNGGASSDHCGTGPQGKGGTGGNGGNGGQGGNSGNGQNVYCTYQTLGPNGSISLGTPTKGQGGQGGNGGNAGNGGTGNPNGGGGTAGSPGASGTNGTGGTVYINNVPQT